jgi:hypothetical protein
MTTTAEIPVTRKRTDDGVDDSNSANVKGALQGFRKAAHYIDVKPITLRRLVKRGFIRPNRALRTPLFPIAELERFLNDPANTTQHAKLAPQNLPGSQTWRQAVANSSRNKKRKTAAA